MRARDRAVTCTAVAAAACAAAAGILAPLAARAATSACTAVASPGNPAENNDTYIWVTAKPQTRVTAVAHYKTTSTAVGRETDPAGHATVPFRISHATRNRPVSVTVTAGAVHCTASFTPRN
jgi:hypothetical protein